MFLYILFVNCSDEDVSIILDKGLSLYFVMDNIIVIENGVCKLLCNLNIYKVSGLDEILIWFIKE